jgi:hypothetical protein
MSKRYRNGFKRTLCRWTLPTPSTSYRNIRSNGLNNNNNNNPPLSPTLACTNNLRHQRLTYSNNNPKSEKINNSFCRRRDNIFTFSMSKYKFVIGSRTLANHRTIPSHHPLRRRTSFHYRFSLVEQQERDEQQQLQLQLQLQQRKFSTNLMQQQNKHRAKFIFTTAIPPPTITPPNSLISEPKNLSNGNPSKH